METNRVHYELGLTTDISNYSNAEPLEAGGDDRTLITLFPGLISVTPLEETPEPIIADLNQNRGEVKAVRGH
jgi:hypothetical protein